MGSPLKNALICKQKKPPNLKFRFRAYNIAYSMVSEVVNGNPYVAQAIRDKIVNAYQRGESTL